MRWSMLTIYCLSYFYPPIATATDAGCCVWIWHDRSVLQLPACSFIGWSTLKCSDVCFSAREGTASLWNVPIWIIIILCSICRWYSVCCCSNGTSFLWQLGFPGRGLSLWWISLLADIDDLLRVTYAWHSSDTYLVVCHFVNVVPNAHSRTVSLNAYHILTSVPCILYINRCAGLENLVQGGKWQRNASMKSYFLLAMSTSGGM